MQSGKDAVKKSWVGAIATDAEGYPVWYWRCKSCQLVVPLLIGASTVGRGGCTLATSSDDGAATTTLDAASGACCFNTPASGSRSHQRVSRRSRDLR